MKKPTPIMAFLFLFFLSSFANADVCDDLSTADNFSDGFNGTTAVSDGSMVTITRGDATVDSGIDWRPGGNGFFSYASESVVTLTPFDDASNNAQYNVNVLFFDDSGSFLNETPWLSTTGSTPESIDVATLFSDPDVEQFIVRFRVIGAEGTTKVFDKMSAVNAIPEPASAAALALLFAGLVSRRRRV